MIVHILQNLLHKTQTPKKKQKIEERRGYLYIINAVGKCIGRKRFWNPGSVPDVPVDDPLSP